MPLTDQTPEQLYSAARRAEVLKTQYLAAIGEKLKLSDDEQRKLEDFIATGEEPPSVKDFEVFVDREIGLDPATRLLTRLGMRRAHE